MYKYIHTCIYIHISCPHTYTHTHIYTHAYKMHIWTHAKHVWNDGVAVAAREAQLDAKKLCPSPCPLQSGGGYPSFFPAILAGFFSLVLKSVSSLDPVNLLSLWFGFSGPLLQWDSTATDAVLLKSLNWSPKKMILSPPSWKKEKNCPPVTSCWWRDKSPPSLTSACR